MYFLVIAFLTLKAELFLNTVDKQQYLLPIFDQISTSKYYTKCLV